MPELADYDWDEEMEVWLPRDEDASKEPVAEQDKDEDEDERHERAWQKMMKELEDEEKREDEETRDLVTTYDVHGPRTTSRLLARTLSTNAKLGHLIRRLILCTNRHEIGATVNHMDILRHCPNLEDLKILGYRDSVVRPYRAIFAQLQSLRTLNISEHSLIDEETACMFDDDILLETLRAVPKIEQVRVPLMCHEYENYQKLRRYAESRGIALKWT